jgi:hypothetical protein
MRLRRYRRGHGTRAHPTTDHGTFRVLVYAGRDPLTGKERRRTATAHSRKEAEQLRTRLLSKIDQCRASSAWR